jgi:hypothetical protein
LRASVVTPSVGVLHSFSGDLYIGGVTEFQQTLWLVGESALSF